MKKGPQVKSKPVPKTKGKAVAAKKPAISTWLPFGIALLLVLTTWYIYKPSLNNSFTNWDDPDYVLENKQVKEFDAASADYFFTHASATNYHPLTMLSLGLDYHITVKDKRIFRESDDLETLQFHTTSLVLHVLNVLLVFLFVFLLSRKRLLVAAVTALLFAIHPLHVESVAWIAERKDVLYTFFFLGGLIVYMRYLEKQGWMRLVIVGLLFVASLFSKPSAVVFPLILLSLDYFYGRKFTLRVFLEKVPFFILSLVFGVVTFVVQAHISVAPMEVFSVFQRLMFGSYGFVMYQFKLLVPLKISAFYPYPANGANGMIPMIYYFAPVMAIAIAGLVYLSTRHTRVISFGYLFFFFSVVLILQFLPVGSAIMADRYTYLSSVGLFFIMAWYLDQAFISKKPVIQTLRWFLAGAFLLYFMFLGMKTMEQTKVWRNSETLWTDVISKYPTVKVAYKNRGNYYGKLNQVDKAMDDYQAFIRMKQNDAGVYSNIGNIYGLRGETEKSLDAYSKSIALDSLEPKTWLNRAITYTRAQQYGPALRDYNRAIILNPGFLAVYENRCYTYREMGRFEDAVSDFSLLISNSPRNDEYYLNRGVCYYKLKKYDEARTDFEQCLALNPANGRACFNISVIFSDLKDYRQAYQYALKAEAKKFAVDKKYLEKLKTKGS